MTNRNFGKKPTNLVIKTCISSDRRTSIVDCIYFRANPYVIYYLRIPTDYLY